jgi:hypothetical protein
MAWLDPLLTARTLLPNSRLRPTFPTIPSFTSPTPHQTANMPSGQGGKFCRSPQTAGSRKYLNMLETRLTFRDKQPVPTPSTTRSPRRRRRSSMRMTSRTRPSSLPVRSHLSHHFWLCSPAWHDRNEGGRPRLTAYTNRQEGSRRTSRKGR